jgi:hypothetical protein
VVVMNVRVPYKAGHLVEDYSLFKDSDPLVNFAVKMQLMS